MMLTELEQKIKNIKALDLKTAPFAEVCRRVRNLIIGYSTVTFPGRRLHLFRARKNPSKDNFSSVRELMYPPAHLVKELGRANDIGEPVLYCAGAAETAILEIHPSVGDEITIMEVEYNLVNQPGGIVGIGLSENAICRSPDKDIVWGVYRDDSIKRHLQKYHSGKENEKIQFNKLLDNFLDEEFRKKASRGSWEYKITAALSKMYINNRDADKIYIDDREAESPIAAITYPSIADNLYEVNLAMNTRAADKALTPRRFKKIRITGRTDSGGYIQEPVCHSEKCDGTTIIW